MKRDRLIALLLLLLAVAYFAAPARRPALTRAAQWWDHWAVQASTNWLPNERGLNVAVLDEQGRLVEKTRFDTYLQPHSGFADYVTNLPADRWVLVAAMDDAATSLSQADLGALQSLGGSGGLAGKRQWSYVLVGRPGLGAGRGLERISQAALDVRLAPGELVGGQAFPIALRVRSAGFDVGRYAAVTTEGLGLSNLWRWIRVALERA